MPAPLTKCCNRTPNRFLLGGMYFINCAAKCGHSVKHRRMSSARALWRASFVSPEARKVEEMDLAWAQFRRSQS